MGEHIGHMAAKGMDGWGKPGIRKRKADVLTNRTIIINTRWQQLIAIRTLHLLHSLINQPHWKLFIRNTLIYNRPMTINHPWNAHRSSSISGSGTLQAALANAVLLLWNALPAFTGIRQTVGATGICVFLYLWVFLRWISRSNQYNCKLFAALSRDTKRQAAGWRGAAVCKLYWSSHGLEFTRNLNRSRDENGSAQLYLLYLSLTAVGVVLLLAISLYCRYPPSMSFLVLEREIALCLFWTLPKFYCWAFFLSQCSSKTWTSASSIPGGRVLHLAKDWWITGLYSSQVMFLLFPDDGKSKPCSAWLQKCIAGSKYVKIGF